MTETQYVANIAHLKVEIGPADGHRVARIIEHGNPLPVGIDPAKLEQLEVLGLITAVQPEPEPDPDAEAKAAAEAQAKADAAAQAKADAEEKAKADAAAKAAAAKTPAK
ncbi:hypothetical protein [Arthrobacter sp. NPDC090010]|uniref:hypothetical protein n=1 Tax=Arthrobacter sp. NPDC090010 TaxID=3363942 RepID=UPI0037FE2EB8